MDVKGSIDYPFIIDVMNYRRKNQISIEEGSKACGTWHRNS